MVKENKTRQSKHIREVVNDWLMVFKLVKWAQSYHPEVEIPKIDERMGRIEKFIEIYFWEGNNRGN